MDEPPSWKNFRKSEPPLRMFDLKFVRAGRSKKLATSVPFLDDPVLERAPILRRVDLPHHDAAETVPFRTDGTDGRMVSQRAGREEPRPDARVHLADLQRFVERRAPDLFLRVVAETHRELVMQVEKVGRLGEPD